MKIALNNNFTKPNFKGTTVIRALTDSHQEARLEAQLLSRISKQAKSNNNILVLNCGDLFGGVYSRDLMVDLYKKFKQANPNVEIVMTIGNNDPITSRDKYAPKNPDDKRRGPEFLKDTIKDFESCGIHVVCANFLDKETGKCPTWIKPYTIIERDGDRIFVTGFCVKRIMADLKDIEAISQQEAFEELKSAIEKEKPDSIIVLNHDYADTSERLFEYAKNQGIDIDLIVNGHDHDNPKSNPMINMYTPKVFSKSMFEMDLNIQNRLNELKNIKEIESGALPLESGINELISDYEAKSGISDVVAPHTLNLPKFYAHPGALGTFIADGIKEISDVNAAFFASNVVRVPLYYKENADILNYDTRKVITFDSTVQKATFNPYELKDILSTAVEKRLSLGEQNSRFLQCSSNIKIVGEGNSADKSYRIVQIYLDNEPLFDENGFAYEPDRQISCAFDNFIPIDGRSEILKNADKKDVILDGKKLRIDEVLKRQLQKAPSRFEKGMTYPKFELIETII
ncbi:MAG: hypothetical protein E7Z88_05430 [Cyanobacteria bacterium SIG27]|nr:hypothetical protein [Cyanobacteria bacterium SIG27]